MSRFSWISSYLYFSSHNSKTHGRKQRRSIGNEKSKFTGISSNLIQINTHDHHIPSQRDWVKLKFTGISSHLNHINDDQRVSANLHNGRWLGDVEIHRNFFLSQSSQTVINNRVFKWKRKMRFSGISSKLIHYTMKTKINQSTWWAMKERNVEALVNLFLSFLRLINDVWEMSRISWFSSYLNIRRKR